MQQRLLSLLIAVCTAFLASYAMAFSPYSSHRKADASTRLGYRNFDDIIIDTSTTKEVASLPPSKGTTQTSKINNIHGSKSAMPPQHYEKATFASLDVDADRSPLSILLEPPTPPLSEHLHTNMTNSRQSSRVTTTRSRATTRSSPITQLLSIQDYHQHVLNEPDQLCIIRFHAPWCQVCRTTNVSWERMASKMVKMTSSKRNIKFFSVSLDGKNEEVEELKDMLQIESVPHGVIHYANEGLFGQKVHLNRKNLSVLKKQLESYLTNEMGADLFLYELKKEM